MGLVTAPVGIAVPSFGLFFAVGLVRGFWRRRPADWRAAIKRLRTWGREETGSGTIEAAGLNRAFLRNEVLNMSPFTFSALHTRFHPRRSGGYS
jgi:hypothetical protein